MTERPYRICVVGGAGCGKTLLARGLAHEVPLLLFGPAVHYPTRRCALQLVETDAGCVEVVDTPAFSASNTIPFIDHLGYSLFDKQSYREHPRYDQGVGSVMTLLSSSGLDSLSGRADVYAVVYRSGCECAGADSSQFDMACGIHEALVEAWDEYNRYWGPARGPARGLAEEPADDDQEPRTRARRNSLFSVPSSGLGSSVESQLPPKWRSSLPFKVFRKVVLDTPSQKIAREARELQQLEPVAAEPIRVPSQLRVVFVRNLQRCLRGCMGSPAGDARAREHARCVGGWWSGGELHRGGEAVRVASEVEAVVERCT